MTSQHQFGDRLQSMASILTRRRPCTRPCSLTRAGLSSQTSQPTGHTPIPAAAVIMAGSSTPTLTGAIGSTAHPLQHRGQRWRRHRELRGTEQPMTVCARHRQHGLVFADFHRDRSRRHVRVHHWNALDRHLGGRSSDQCGLAGLVLVSLAALIGRLWAGRIKKGDRTRIGIA
jgi:hypothetical protein